jgi:hypothetical protein
MPEESSATPDQVLNADRNLPVRARFLTAISVINPGVLQSLGKLSDAQPRMPTRRELKRWARVWNLEAEWIVEWAAQTIKWQRKGPSRRWDRFYHPRWSPRSRFERRPANINETIQNRVREIDFGNWIGDPKAKAAVRQRAVHALQQILEDAFEEVETTETKRAGLFELRTRRSRGSTKKSDAPKRSENETFLWLAGYQTLAWSRGQIAEALDVSRNAVGMSIRSLAAELKMELRPERLYDKSQTAEIIRRELESARAEERASELFLMSKHEGNQSRGSTERSRPSLCRSHPRRIRKILPVK